MPKEKTKKIKSVPKKKNITPGVQLFRRPATIFILISATFSLALAITTILILNNRTSNNSNLHNQNTCQGLKIKSDCFYLERALSNPAKIKGLSERDNLPAKSAMLFVFDSVGEQCIWMKDMRFNLDIIWLDETKKIKKIEQNVPPSTYPATFCSRDTKYVLEFNKGAAQKYGLRLNDVMVFYAEGLAGASILPSVKLTSVNTTKAY